MVHTHTDESKTVRFKVFSHIWEKLSFSGEQYKDMMSGRVFPVTALESPVRFLLEFDPYGPHVLVYLPNSGELMPLVWEISSNATIFHAYRWEILPGDYTPLDIGKLYNKELYNWCHQLNTMVGHSEGDKLFSILNRPCETVLCAGVR